MKIIRRKIRRQLLRVQLRFSRRLSIDDCVKRRPTNTTLISPIILTKYFYFLFSVFVLNSFRFVIEKVAYVDGIIALLLPNEAERNASAPDGFRFSFLLLLNTLTKHNKAV